MNNQIIGSVAATLVLLIGVIASASSATEVLLRKSLTSTERRCLMELLQSGHWRITPQFHQAMIASAVVGRADLNGNGREEYIFVIDEPASCGTSGCSMLIGEARNDGICHEIYSDAGSESAITVLPGRDHGYRRLLTPCEVRFDGREYAKIHDDCPNDNVQR
jgi:hypothetical protein